MHNIAYLLNLMAQVRKAIIQDQFPQFLRQVFGKWYKGEKEKFPKWAVDALGEVGIDLLADD
jgi:queuine tRNA-ribosyltransferase